MKKQQNFYYVKCHYRGPCAVKDTDFYITATLLNSLHSLHTPQEDLKSLRPFIDYLFYEDKLAIRSKYMIENFLGDVVNKAVSIVFEFEYAV